MENLSASSNRVSVKRLPIVGKYRLLAEIGHGGMAEVFLAVMEGPAKFSKLIALKMLRSQFAEDPEGREMFLNEARLAARLNHPHVVQTYEVGEIDQRYFIAMEYLEGQPFSRVLQRARSGEHQALPLGLALRIVADSLSGLEYAHDLKDFDGSPLNLVHRDISPHNVFVTYDGSVKVLDFGIAKAAGSGAETRTGVLKGKVGYMAPEQISDLSPDRRVDIYATGGMLWEAIAGRKVWKGLSEVATLSKVATEGVPALKSVVPDVDPELERLVMKACARSRDQRHATAAELQAELEAYLEKMPGGGKASTRGVAKWIGEVFKDTREETKRLVETQLTRAKSIPPEGMPSASFPSTLSLSASQEVSHPGTGSGQRAAATGSQSHSVTLTVPAGASKVVITVAALAALAVGGFIALRSNGLLTTATPAPSATTTTPAPPGSALVKVAATPSDAKIAIDGIALSGNPAQLTVNKDGKSHVLHVQRDGHTAKDETFVGDGDKSFVIALEKEPATEPSSAPTPAVVTKPAATPIGKSGKSQPTATTIAPPPPAATPTPTPTSTSTKKKIDEENPFK